MTRLTSRITGLVFLAILGWGVWQGGAALWLPQSRARLTESWTMTAFLAGRTAGAVNHVMAHDLPADPWLRAAGGLWRLPFGAAGPQVRLGCDGWLFLTEELRPWPDADAAMLRRIATLSVTTAELAKSGITLLPVIVPDKSRIAAAFLCGAPRSEQAEQRLPVFLALAQARGLAPVDLSRALRPEDFHRTDTHWNPQGAAHAATAIAASVPDAAPGAPPPPAEARPYWGDLVRLMSLDVVPELLRPRPDELRPIAYKDVQAEGGLLDDAPAPHVALIGTSFSRNGQFDRALETALGTSVLNAARDGGGFGESARAYFASPAFRETPPKLVIWEIPERVLGQPIGEDGAVLPR